MAGKEDKMVILIGAYKGNQLEKWPGYYNYPISDADKITNADAACIRELWLFKGTINQKSYAAEFIGVKTREELIADYAYPATGKAHSNKYLLFKTTPIDTPSTEYRSIVLRIKDFSSSKKLQAQLTAYLESDNREEAEITTKLPDVVYSIPKEKLTVCESVFQLDFLDVLSPCVDMHCTVPAAIRDNNMPVIDLFAGCGGMSLGFEFAGFHPVLAVEKDDWASQTYAHNRPGVFVMTGDITQIKSPKEQFSHVKEVFGIIGGPPCQGFSLSGDRDPKDPRNSLFMDYMRFVEDFKPSFFVMENVPGILSAVTKVGEPVKDVILSVAKNLGYNVKVMQLNASDYGVPQARLRVFFIGIRNDYPFDADKLTPKKTTADCPITIQQAISDLPKIQACEGVEEMMHETAPENEYQKWCRQGTNTVYNHVAMRHTPRLVARFHIIQYGQSLADVPQEHKQRKRGDAASISGKVYSQNNMRPFPDRPSPTIPASFQSNFVHPFFDRNYTAREGARLQSFPDSYIFCGKRTTMSWEKNLSQYQQIGNAVPPLLAKALGDMIKDYFSNIKSIKHRI